MNQFLILAVLADLARVDLKLQQMLESQQDIVRRLSEMSDNNTKFAAAIAQVEADMQNQTTVIASFQTFLTSYDAKMQAALDAAKAAGVTDDQLAEVTGLHTELVANNTALQAALVARTPLDPAAPAPATDPTATTVGGTPATPTLTAPAAVIPEQPIPAATNPAAPVTDQPIPAATDPAAPTTDQPIPPAT